MGIFKILYSARIYFVAVQADMYIAMHVMSKGLQKLS